MCGRTCLTLEPAAIQNCCKYAAKSKDDAPQTDLSPEWRAEFNFGKKYEPSFNVAPTDIAPVLVSADHFGDDDDQKSGRLIVPMMWGMIPFWHKGDYKKHGLTTNNCRLEHMLESKLFRGPFSRGQRCVILCEGFYEWQTTKSAKPSERAAYYFHMPQSENVKIYDKTTWTSDSVNLLKLAGLFDVWEDENGDKIFSYSAITFESSKIMSWLHYRMPAILETEEQISDWLDFKRVSNEKALATLRPAKTIKWHQVTNLVNNSRNKSELCNKPLSDVASIKAKSEPKSKIMKSWLIVRKRKEEELKKQQSESEEGDSDEAPIDVKRMKFSKKSDSSVPENSDKKTEEVNE